ncbi:MAG TPA: PilZ domain-containing protein [Nitrospiria bacterium]
MERGLYGGVEGGYNKGCRTQTIKEGAVENNKPADRRKFQRVAILQEVYFGNRKTRRMDDISEDGLFIATPETFMVGSLLDLKFRLLGDPHYIEVKGEVRYVEEGVGMGVQFITLSPEDRGKIRKFVGKF